MLAPLLLAGLAGCGSSLELLPDFDPASTSAVADGMAPLDLDFQDAFFVTATLQDQPMVGVLATTIDDACAVYSDFVPIADADYQAMLNLHGGSEEEAVQQDWQDNLAQRFPVGTTTLFMAFGVDEFSTEAVVGSYDETVEIASATLDDTEGPQPSGTFVADIFVVAEGLDVYCIYSGLCDDAAGDAAWNASYNQWSADSGTLTIDKFSAGRRLSGEMDIHLVNRWKDAEFGVPAPLGDASGSFDVKPCETLDERIFRFWELL